MFKPFKLYIMKNLNFTLKDDVELYLTNFFNVSRYKELTESPVFKNLFDPLTFFNLFWQSRSLILLNKAKPLKVLYSLLNLDLNPRQRYYLLENLIISFNYSLYPQFCIEENDLELSICLEFITYECEKLCQALYPANEIQNLLFNFSIIKKHTALIHNDHEKLIFLISVKTNYLQYVNSTNSSLHSAFDILCDLEIKKIRKIIKLSSYSIPVIAQSSLASSYSQGTAPSPVSLLPVSLSPKSDPIKKFIDDNICAIDSTKWHYVFKSEPDYSLFLDKFSDFFSQKEVDLNFELSLKTHCKTRLCPLLKYLYSHYETTALKNDFTFLAMVHNLSPFKSQTSSQIYFDLIRRGEFP
jgi:hypothetical protein